MTVVAKAEMVSSSIKGQVVSPRQLCKEFEIEEGEIAWLK
jgi:hypothetical protein